MRNKKNAVIAFLVAAVLCIGIAFAANLSDTLTLDGDAAITPSLFKDEFDDYVKFTSVTATTASTGDKSYVEIKPVASTTDDAANIDTYTVSIAAGAFTATADTIVIEAVISSTAPQKVKVTVATPTITNLGDYISVECDKTSAELAAYDGSATDNDSATFTITVTLNALPATDVTGTFDIVFTAEPAV